MKIGNSSFVLKFNDNKLNVNCFQNISRLLATITMLFARNVTIRFTLNTIASIYTILEKIFLLL